MKPPPRKLPPPRRRNSDSIIGKYVTAFKDKEGYTILTNRMKMPVGRRLDKGKGSYPDIKAFGLSYFEAGETVRIWDIFLEQQNKK